MTLLVLKPVTFLLDSTLGRRQYCYFAAVVEILASVAEAAAVAGEVAAESAAVAEEAAVAAEISAESVIVTESLEEVAGAEVESLVTEVESAEVKISFPAISKMPIFPSNYDL